MSTLYCSFHRTFNNKRWTLLLSFLLFGLFFLLFYYLSALQLQPLVVKVTFYAQLSVISWFQSLLPFWFCQILPYSYLLIFFLHFIPLLFPDLREFESYLFAVLSTLHCVQSALRRQDKDVFHFWAIRPFLFPFLISLVFFSWEFKLFIFLTTVWKPWWRTSERL